MAISLLPSEREGYARILQNFTDSTGIAIELVAQQYQQIREALRAEASAGSGQLDIVELDVYFLFDVSGYMYPLDSLMGSLTELRGAVGDEAWHVGIGRDSGEGTVFVPHRLNWQAMIYDAVRLPEPPRTWDDLRSLARLRPASIGFKGARYEGLSCDFFPFLWQAGGDPLNPESPAALEALALLADLREGVHPNSIAFKENSILQAQEHEEILLHFNWPFVVPLLRERGLLPERIQTAPLPQGPQGSATVLGGGYLGIPKTSTKPEQASRVLEFVTSELTQRRLARELGWFPARLQAWDALDSDAREAARGFIEMKDMVRARPLVAGYEAVSKAWQLAVSRVLFEGLDPSEALLQVKASINQLSPTDGSMKAKEFSNTPSR
jgi:ABC-type glycerol-3-phosphate transport system substrate-binding protein